MSTKDYLEKDYYKRPRRPQGRHRGRDQEGLPQARPPVPPRRQPGRRRPRSASSRRSPRPTTSCPTSKRRKEYDEARALFGSGVRAAAAGRRRRRLPVRPRRPVRRHRQPAAAGHGAGGGSATCSAACSTAAAAGPYRPAHQAAARPGHRVRGHAHVHRGDRRRHGVAAADQLGRLPGLQRHRAPRPAPPRGSARPARAPGRPAATWATSPSPSPAATAAAAAWSSTTRARSATAAAGPSAPARSRRASPPG